MKTFFQNIIRKSVGPLILICGAILLYGAPGFAQVSPSEISNRQLKAEEQAYLTKLVAINRAIAKMKFPFPFSLSRYAGLDPKDQIGVDGRGLEFVKFHDRLVLKLTGNYNAAYNADLLTPNQRAGRVFDETIVPILRLYPSYFSPNEGFNAFGFEISYHVRRRTNGYEYEGKEILVLVIDKADVSNYLNAKDESDRQEVLNRSEIYLNGKDFGLAINEREPLNVEELERGNQSSSAASLEATPTSTDSGVHARIGQNSPVLQKSMGQMPQSAMRPETRAASTTVAATQADAERLQSKYQSRLDEMAKEGMTKYHFVDYAPPSFVVFQNQLFLQLTMRNPLHFEKETSIYKRAAQSFDLFLALQLKSILEKIPDDMECAGLDVTILNELASNSTQSSEALEFICPLKLLRQFVGAEITNQDLINQSVVLVNGVRIALNLQQVE